MRRSAFVSACTSLLLACDAGRPGASSSAADGGRASQAALQDPETCRPCHAQHFREWQSSMHAYAAKDPVFIAMNERGQRETNGALGAFCIRCHAPMAFELGLSSDGLNLPDLHDPNARGVTCYFCHNASSIAKDHNRGPELAHDTTLRAGLGPGASMPENAAPPHANAVHDSAYSALHDGLEVQSAALCGSCHDIRNDAGVALERTFAEWRGSRFASAGPEQQTCPDCHMPTYDGSAAPGGPPRTLHRHLWPGVDLALTNMYPGVKAQTAAIACAFGDALALELSAPNQNEAVVTLQNRKVGHAWPSGSAQDRRAWLQLTAYAADGGVLYQSGAVAAGAVVGDDEPTLAVLRDRLYDADARAVHMFWLAAPSDAHPNGYESTLLPPPSADEPARTQRYALPKDSARVTASLQLQAIGLDVIDDFAGLTLPITERVIGDVYMNMTSLRARIRTITVPGSERELVLHGGVFEGADPPAADSGCAEQRYVDLLDDAAP